MAEDIKEVKRWLETLDPENEIAVDDGGLCLVELNGEEETGAYYEIGGVPLLEEE